MKQQKVLEDCEAVYAATTAEEKPGEVAEAMRSEAVAVAEAVHALQVARLFGINLYHAGFSSIYHGLFS